MLTPIRRLLNQFFRRTRTINNEPLNKVSLIVIILIDIFILFNVFAGLDNISRWPMSPSQAYPCYSEWESYRKQAPRDKDFDIIRRSLPPNTNNQPNLQKFYQQTQEEHLGQVSPTCQKYAGLKEKINNSANQQTLKIIDQQQAQISKLEQSNRNIRAQYDSTLLEKIAGQERGKSINLVGPEKAKQELDQNNRNIAQSKKEITKLKTALLTKPESVSFLAFVKNGDNFGEVKTGYDKAYFWYPSIQLAFQSLFLLPLILLALSVHKFALRRGYGLIALMSWHLLVIFFIPLVLKVFEFLQVGAIFQFLFDIISTLFKGLVFLINYLYILLIPVIGFGIIKFVQKIVLNPKHQTTKRVQRSECLRCAKKIRPQDSFCPHCGYYQYVECQNCHNLTYKNLSYCKHCGASQNLGNL
jgi:RNA polymerase subunit RPABC4/transcription elongation factor Spt4